MNIKDFEKQIPPKILTRGYSYFKNHHIISLVKEESCTWFAEVEGNGNYSVTIETEGNELVYWDCKCPFEGETCIHIVAVLYAVADIEFSQNDSAGSHKNRMRKNVIDDILKKASKEDLAEFIKMQSSKDHSFRNTFTAHFAEYIDEDAVNKYMMIVKNIIKTSEDRYGFIDYRSARIFTKNMETLLKKSEMLLENGNINESLAICKAMIELIPSIIMDDSDGGIQILFDYTFNIFSQISKKAKPELRDALFLYCMNKYSELKKTNYDFGDEILYILPDLITTEEQEKDFFNLLDKQIKHERANEYSEYKVRYLIQVKINFLSDRNRKEEAWKLVEDNRLHPEFMVMIVDKLLEKKDYNKAIELCFEGIKIAEGKRHPGTVHEWNEKLLSIYESTKNIAEIRKMSEKLFFKSNFQLKYYKQLKSTYEKSEWPGICEGIINKIKGKNAIGSYYANTLADIFVVENYRERLLKLLQLSPEEINFINRYAKHLKNLYPGELILLYESGIKKLAENTGRRYYNEVAGYLKSLQQITGGDEKVKSLVNYFHQIYKNRRAMMQVLDLEF